MLRKRLSLITLFMNRTIVLLFLLTNTVPLLAQISGQVLCNDTRKPIPYANVYTAEGIAVAYADENGKFEFADSKLSMPLFFTAVGYGKKVFTADTITDAIFLDPKIINLAEVII